MGLASKMGAFSSTLLFPLAFGHVLAQCTHPITPTSNLTPRQLSPTRPTPTSTSVTAPLLKVHLNLSKEGISPVPLHPELTPRHLTDNPDMDLLLVSLNRGTASLLKANTGSLLNSSSTASISLLSSSTVNSLSKGTVSSLLKDSTDSLPKDNMDSRKVQVGISGWS